MTHFGLADAVDTAEPLFEAVGVPRQVVVHHQVGALEIDPLSRSVGGKQHPDFGIVAECFLRFEPVAPIHPTMDHDHSLGATDHGGDAIMQVVERVLVFGEDDQLLTGRRLGGWDRSRTVSCRGLLDVRGQPGGSEDLAQKTG